MMGPEELGPQHRLALNKARNAVLAEQRKFEKASDIYGRKGQYRSEKDMSDQAMACREVAEVLANLRDQAVARTEPGEN